MSIGGQSNGGYKFSTDGVLGFGMGMNMNNILNLNNNIGSTSTLNGNGRAQTSVAGSRLNVNRAHLSSYQNYVSQGIGASSQMGTDSNVNLNSAMLPQTNIPGMSI